ncbi:uncharacterized protein LOC119661849 [Teleopsis dalmanni]|uniref:uncharacterized protein LOC119661849 n=1 Tax=Teleopsis dalmanni TaxID=139649 RepID=UPI0018CD37EF|nr:uncharacterized protein LOC119661849 [Teleopsis dalmanni]
MENAEDVLNTHKIIVFELLSNLTNKFIKFNHLRMEYSIKLCDLKNKTRMLMSQFSASQDNPISNLEIEILSRVTEDIKRQHIKLNGFYSLNIKKVIHSAKKSVLELIVEKKKLIKIFNEIIFHLKRNILPDRRLDPFQFYVRPIVETQVCFFISIRKMHKTEEKLKPFFKILNMNGMRFISPKGCLPLWLYSNRGIENMDDFIDSSYEATCNFSDSFDFKDGDSTRDNISDNMDD